MGDKMNVTRRLLNITPSLFNIEKWTYKNIYNGGMYKINAKYYLMIFKMSYQTLGDQFSFHHSHSNHRDFLMYNSYNIDHKVDTCTLFNYHTLFSKGYVLW